MKHRRRIWLACVPVGVALASGCAGTEPDPRPASASDVGSAFTVIDQPATGQLLDDLTSAPDITRGSGCAGVWVDASGNITGEMSGDCGEISYPRPGDVPLVVGSLRLDDDAEALFVTFTARDGTACYAVVLRDGAEPVEPATCYGWDDLSGKPPGPCSRFCVEQLGLGRFVDTPFVVALVPEEGRISMWRGEMGAGSRLPSMARSCQPSRGVGCSWLG